MIELLPHVMKAMLKATYKTETFSQTSISAPAFVNWRNERVGQMIENAERPRPIPISKTVITAPSQRSVVSGPTLAAPDKPAQGISGGAPVTTTRTTVRYRVK